MRGVERMVNWGSGKVEEDNHSESPGVVRHGAMAPALARQPGLPFSRNFRGAASRKDLVHFAQLAIGCTNPSYNFYKINYIHNRGLQVINFTYLQVLGRLVLQNTFWETEILEVFGKLLFAKRVLKMRFAKQIFNSRTAQAKQPLTSCSSNRQNE